MSRAPYTSTQTGELMIMDNEDRSKGFNSKLPRTDLNMTDRVSQEDYSIFTVRNNISSREPTSR
jgi:hypothetical protein